MTGARSADETRASRAQVDDHRLLSARRVLAMLEALAVRPGGATPKELSQALDLHLSSCYRLLHSLVAAGYVVRCPGGGLFRLGRRVAFLHHGYLATITPPAEAVPFVNALAMATGETAMLHHLEGDDVVLLAAVAGSRPAAHPPGYIGHAVPAHALAAGRALLAKLPAAQREAYLARHAGNLDVPFPMVSPGALRQQLEQIRARGSAIDRGDVMPGTCCIAAPVDGHEGSPAVAITVVAPCVRFARDEPALIAAVQAVVSAIAAIRGSSPARDERAAATEEDVEVAQQAAITAAQATVAAAMSRVG